MNAKPPRQRRSRKVKITPEMWESFFRDFNGPLFVEDVGQVLNELDKVRVKGVTEIGPWLDAHPDFLVRVMSQLRVVDASEAAVAWAGAKDRADLFASLDRMVVPETLPAIKAILVDLFEGKGSHAAECQYRSLDGRALFSYNQALLPAAGAGPDLVFLAITDITELKLMQRQLSQSHERYGRLVEAAQDVILCHDLAGRVTFVNRAATEISGWHRDQLLDRDVGLLLPEVGPDGARRQNLERLGKVRGRTLYEATLRTKDNREIPVEVNSTVIPNLEGADNEPLLLAMIRDVSDRKEAERRQRDLEIQLKNTQRMESLGVLAGGIAHDFNNLLVTIMGNTELMLSGRYSQEELRNTLQLVLEASTQAADLCRQMQAYAGQTVAVVAREELNSIVDNISRLLQVTVAGRAHISFQLGEKMPAVEVDAGQIRQVLMNLVTNAAESLGEDGGEIAIRTGHRAFSAADLRKGHHVSLLQPGDYVYCQVSDSGAGMSIETVQRVFDPFFTTKGAKRGLGMSSALGIIQSHRGGFLVDSQPGKGTTISFLLPAAAEPVKRKAAANRRKKEPDMLHLNLAGKTVLAVDEDAAVRSVGEGFLRRLGCKVLSAGNGLDAVRIFGDRHQEIDAVLLDLTMEGMDGVETCRRLRVIRPDLPVVFSSGFPVEEVHQRAGEVGSYGYVAKPFRLAQIRSIMAEALSERAETDKGK
jgi:two-component system cell cycle sensor histidine kinase/response regulator CckA